MQKLSELKREAAALLDRQDAIQKEASEANEGKGRELTPAELAEIDENDERLASIQEQIEAHNKLQARREAMVGVESGNTGNKLSLHGDTLEGDTPARSAATATADSPARRRSRDLKPSVIDKKIDEIYPTYGRMLRDVIRAGYKPDPFMSDPLRELRAATIRHAELSGTAPTTFGNEAFGTDGGFLVPPVFSPEVESITGGEESILALCDVRPTEGNDGNLIVNETTGWSTDGVQVYWTEEAGAITQSKPKVKNVKVPLHKIAALVPLTEEVMQDAAGLEAHVNDAVPEKFNFAINRALLAGTGAGKPLGLLNAAALKQVAQQGSQNDTIVHANVAKMYAAMPQKWRKAAVFIANPNTEPQYLTMVDGNGNLIYNNGSMFPGTASMAPPEGLMGKRIIFTEACETLGDVGDIYFSNMKAYAAYIKSSGMQRSISSHLWFDFDTQALKYTFRVGGQPKFTNVITGRDGSSTYSPFVALAVRAG